MCTPLLGFPASVYVRAISRWEEDTINIYTLWSIVSINVLPLGLPWAVKMSVIPVLFLYSILLGSIKLLQLVDMLTYIERSHNYHCHNLTEHCSLTLQLPRSRLTTQFSMWTIMKCMIPSNSTSIWFVSGKHSVIISAIQPLFSRILCKSTIWWTWPDLCLWMMRKKEFKLAEQLC